MGSVEWTVSDEVVEWRGPSPYVFLPMTAEDSADLRAEAAGLVYWGQIAVAVELGGTRFQTALFPQGDRYLVPLRAAVRSAEGVEIGMRVTATVRVRHDR